MSYQLNISANMSAKIDAQQYGISNNSIVTVSSSNAIQQTLTVTGSSWSPVSTGQILNVQAIGIYNDNSVYSSSVVNIATGSSGQNLLTVIAPGNMSLINWSGSLSSLYASATTGNTASIQYYIQNS